MFVNDTNKEDPTNTAVMRGIEAGTAVDELRVPIPLYRHAAPSAPWPWMDLKRDDADVPKAPVVSVTSTLVEGEGEERELERERDDGQERAGGDRDRDRDRDGNGGAGQQTWCGYPQCLFGNWTPDQVRRCRIFEVMGCGGGGACVVYRVDMFRSGAFRGGEGEDEDEDEEGGGDGDGDGSWRAGGGGVDVVDDQRAKEALWIHLGVRRDKGVRLRALFVERMSGPVLQILGTRYNVEPFFFSSSANWIPSRYQEDLQPGKGDHITVVLPFVRLIRNEHAVDEGTIIDTQAPLHLSGNAILLQDLLAFHMIRTTTSDTILSYHPHSLLRRGSASRLRSLLRRTGESVYWSKLYKRCEDTTIVLLALLWHAAYAWDEALEVLYDHLNKILEGRALSTTHVVHTRELHKVRAHLICYKQLLWDFRATVTFVKHTTNPAMHAASVTKHERETAAEILELEADHLLGEIERMEKQREMQTDRVINAMSLAFSTVKSEDTRAMHKLTSTTIRDASTTKQVSYFTLVFLPSYFMAGVFRMNVKEVNPHATETLAHYIEGTIIFTLCTAWLVIAMQDVSSFHPGGRHVVRRVGWPVFYLYEVVQRTSWPWWWARQWSERWWK